MKRPRPELELVIIYTILRYLLLPFVLKENPNLLVISSITLAVLIFLGIRKLGTSDGFQPEIVDAADLILGITGIRTEFESGQPREIIIGDGVTIVRHG